jgi:hypothetical protein
MWRLAIFSRGVAHVRLDLGMISVYRAAFRTLRVATVGIEQYEFSVSRKGRPSSRRGIEQWASERSFDARKLAWHKPVPLLGKAQNG